MNMNDWSVNDQLYLYLHGLQMVVSLFGAFCREIPFAMKWRQSVCTLKLVCIRVVLGYRGDGVCPSSYCILGCSIRLQG